uniref:PiggyBac transposable element-derived protein domain-containing protein n=1 Tax=Amphimedon queenslandica TaxID=400682 RepID=A0A1X7VHX0_AMPQE
MVPYHSHSSLKQYMPQKPIKIGFKVWVRADSTNGYISQFQVYTRKETSSTEKGLGSLVVKDLTATIQHSNHHVYCDNFSQVFSYSLTFYLLEYMHVAP